MSKHIVVSISPYEGHFGEWLCYLPDAGLMDLRPKTLSAPTAEKALSMLPAMSRTDKAAGLAYMVCLQPDHPLSTSIATEEWPRCPGRLSPLNNYTPGVLLLERLYELPHNPVWYGVEFTFIGGTAVPGTLMIQQVRDFAQKVLDTKLKTEKALHKAFHP